jgi:AAA domain
MNGDESNAALEIVKPNGRALEHHLTDAISTLNDRPIEVRSNNSRIPTRVIPQGHQEHERQQQQAGARHSDARVESAVLGTIVTGLFNDIPRQKLLPGAAFMDDRYSIIYRAALSLRSAGAIVAVRSVNEVLERTGAWERLQKLLDPEGKNSPELWKLWHQNIDVKAFGDAKTTLPVEDSLIELGNLYRERETYRIFKAGHEGLISRQQARDAFDALDQANGNSPSYTFRDSEEILAMQFPAGDLLLSNGYLAKGDSTVFCGAPGIGKSRLANQLAICCALGWPFLGWETNAMDVKWLFLQTENGNKRLQADLSAMLGNLTTPQRQMVKDAISWHTLETEEDGIMFLSSEHAIAGIREAIHKRKPDIVVFDPLRDFAIGDLNSDADMGATLSVISRLTREGNPKRIPFIVHHALTGKAGIAKAVGFERSGFSRNSKVLTGWARAQVNLAPGDPDNNEVMVVSSGKANNAAEFEAFPIALDIDTGTYAPDDSFDMAAWRVRIGADSPKEAPRATIATAVKFVERVGLDGIAKAKLVKALKEEGVGQSYAYRLVDLAERAKSIVRRKTDDLYVVPKPVQK